MKYPQNLTVKDYFLKKFEEYKNSGRYSELLDDEIKNLLKFVLTGIHGALSGSKEKLQQNMGLLLKIGSISHEEYLKILNDEEESSYSLGALSLAIHKPTDAVGVIANNGKITFRSDKQSQYEMFLKEVIPCCIKEVIEVNPVKSNTKVVRFSDDVVSKSQAHSRASKFR